MLSVFAAFAGPALVALIFAFLVWLLLRELYKHD